MRNFTFTILVLIVFSYSAAAQKFTILPQVGLENPLTKVSLNDLSEFTPLKAQLAPALGVRMDYQFKKGFGPFVGVSTSRSTVAYNFASPEASMSTFNSTAGDYQLQLAAGMQMRTKPIYFKKTSAQSKPALTSQSKPAYKSCGRYAATSRCGLYKKSESRMQAPKSPQNKGLFVSVQPSAGVAVNPFAPNDLATKTQSGQALYTYNAGNLKTALLTGVAFELGNNDRRLFTVSVNYFKGLGNNEQTITTQTGTKTITTNLASQTSGWNASIGIPFTFGKKVKPQQEYKPVEYKKPAQEQYKSRCGRRVI